MKEISLVDANILNSLYKNCSMGKTAIKTILPSVKSKTLKNQLLHQYKHYSEQCNTYLEQLKDYGVQPKDIGKMQKAMANMSIIMSTAVNSSNSHIAEMMINGTNMGVIDITKNLNKYKGLISNHIKEHADDMLHCEQEYINKLKQQL